MTEQAIGYHFMLPDFKSRGQPSPRSTGPGRPCVGMNVRGILSQLGWIWDKFGTILIFYINIEHVFQLNILLKITFIAYKMEVLIILKRSRLRDLLKRKLFLAD